ncbi:MAG: sigma 54-interacting transcriptional regulator [Clostridiales Family XIII bacterium]|jgi:transcriptional regulator with PAS, ATPase and Fis domain|nr:sigma 54-interacting transcriptional regulator [Clostridiales Family XIII bacterium]
MKRGLVTYVGALTTDNFGSIVDLDDFVMGIFHVNRKSEAIGLNIAHFIPEYSIDAFYLGNQNYNVQPIQSLDCVAFSSYHIKDKRVFLKILFCGTEVISRLLQSISDDNISGDALYFLMQAFSGGISKFEIADEDKVTTPIGTSREMQDLLELIGRVSATHASILLTGETGVGKSLFARLIHDSSDRKDEPFIEINCATIPENLIESELFGYVRGAFTGASAKGKIGKIGMANKGTLFLDEITEMPLGMQQKLLDIIQSRRICRIGSTVSTDIDFRLISATNRNLLGMIKQNKFREDLYYRINVIPVNIPSLRSRESDILSLLLHFTRKNNEKYGKNKSFSEDAIQAFCRYDWPGNVRELENLVERVILLSISDIIKKKDLPAQLQEADALEEKQSSRLKDLMRKHEKGIIIEAYAKYKTSVLVGEKLGISQTCAAQKIREYI